MSFKKQEVKNNKIVEYWEPKPRWERSKDEVRNNDELISDMKAFLESIK